MAGMQEYMGAMMIALKKMEASLGWMDELHQLQTELLVKEGGRVQLLEEYLGMDTQRVVVKYQDGRPILYRQVGESRDWVEQNTVMSPSEVDGVVGMAAPDVNSAAGPSNLKEGEVLVQSTSDDEPLVQSDAGGREDDPMAEEDARERVDERPADSQMAIERPADSDMAIDSSLPPSSPPPDNMDESMPPAEDELPVPVATSPGRPLDINSPPLPPVEHSEDTPPPANDRSDPVPLASPQPVTTVEIPTGRAASPQRPLAVAVIPPTPESSRPNMEETVPPSPLTQAVTPLADGNGQRRSARLSPAPPPAGPRRSPRRSPIPE